MGWVKSALVMEEKCISHLLILLIPHNLLCWELCHVIPVSWAAASGWLPTLTHSSFPDVGLSPWKAGPCPWRRSKRDIQRLHRLSAFLNRTGDKPSQLVHDPACVRKHLWANYQTHRNKKKSIPVAEAQFSSLLCIFHATYRLPHCILKVPPTILPFSLRLNFIILSLNSTCELG